MHIYVDFWEERYGFTSDFSEENTQTYTTNLFVSLQRLIPK